MSFGTFSCAPSFVGDVACVMRKKQVTAKDLLDEAVARTAKIEGAGFYAGLCHFPLVSRSWFSVAGCQCK